MQIVSDKSEDIKKERFDIVCKRCGYTNRLIYSEKKMQEKRICKHCGYYVFRNKKDEFEFRLGNLLKNGG